LTAALSVEDASRIKFVHGSVNDVEACRTLVARADTGYHIASALSGSAAALFTSNVVATRVLLQAVREYACRRFVLVSSIAVYGTDGLAKNAVLDENSALDTRPHMRDPYAFSKIIQEQVCWAAFTEWQLPLVVVRPGIIYGPGRECLTVRVGLKVGPLLVRMGGRQSLPYTYVDNCAEGVVLAGLVDGINGAAFNIVDDVLPTGRQLVREYQRRVGRIASIGIPLWAVRPLSRMYTAYSNFSRGQLPPILTPYRAVAQWNSFTYPNAKAKALLRWTSRVPLAEGLHRALGPVKNSSTQYSGTDTPLPSRTPSST
jgi:nucleoside-diphosphate-sugar epimerase